MNVVQMMPEIDLISNPMIGESALPDFLIAADDRPKFMRVGAFDQLDCPLDGYVVRRRQQEMNVFGHDDESVQFVADFAPIAIKSFQEEADIIFDDEQFTAVVRREGHEVSSRRGEESSRLQGETSAAGSRTSFRSLNWHEWNSCPSRWFFVRGFSFWEGRD